MREGGNVDSDHRRITGFSYAVSVFTSTLDGNKKTAGNVQECFKDRCAHCGAVRVDNQLGVEFRPEQYIASVVAIFAEVKRVLRKDGTLWLNIGDTYSSASDGGFLG